MNLDEIEELLKPPKGWSPLEEQRYGPASQANRKTGVGSFVPWHANDRLSLRLYRREDDGALVGRAWFGLGAMGPPKAVHGGAQAAVLDHALGAAAWIAGYPSFTVSYTHEYRQMVPIEQVYNIVTSIDSVDGRKVRVSGTLLQADDDGALQKEEPTVFSEASGLFLRFSGEVLSSFVSDRTETLEGVTPDGVTPEGVG